MKKNKIRIIFNSPVILTFAGLCLAAMILNLVSHGYSNTMLFCTYRSGLKDPLTYVRLIGHVLGHADWQHLVGNMSYILLLGPLLEEKYGGKRLIAVILAVAITTGIVNSLLFPRSALLGASGICFAFILLSSFTSVREGEIPITFILVALIYLGQQIYDGFFVNDNVSNLAHILGGIMGAAAGFLMAGRNKHKGKHGAQDLPGMPEPPAVPGVPEMPVPPEKPEHEPDAHHFPPHPPIPPMPDRNAPTPEADPAGADAGKDEMQDSDNLTGETEADEPRNLPSEDDVLAFLKS